MANAKANVSGDFSGLIKESEKAAKALLDLGAKAASLANPFTLATKVMGDMVSGLGKIGLAAQGLEAITKSAAAMGIGLLQGNANLEMTTISFKTLLGSASAANDMIQQLTTFAAATPFNLPGLESSTQRLLAFGFQAKDIIPLMTSMGDAIAALGGTQDNLNSLVYVMGQMHSEAHINAGDIMQMTNLGIPALQMLADHYKVTTGEIQNMISKGLIPGTAAVDIFTKGLEAKYGGMMVAQSATFSGMISNLQDWATATTIILTKPFFEPAKKALAAFLAFVQSPQGVAVINKMAADIQIAVDKATAAFIRFEPQIKPILERLLTVAKTVASQLTPPIITLIPILEKLAIKFEPLALSAWKFYQTIQPLSIVIDALKGFLTGGLTGALDALKDRFELIGSYAQKGFDMALVEAKKFGPELLHWAEKVAVDLGNQVMAWGQSFGAKLTTPFRDVILIFNSLVTNIRGVVIPAFEKMAGFLATNLMPLIDRLAVFTARTIIPVLASLAAFVMQVLVPAFVRVADVAGLIFGPALTVIGRIITNELLPTLTRLWGIFDAKYMPTVRALATAFGERLAVGIQLADTRFKQALPTIEAFLKKIEPVVVSLVKFYAAISPISLAMTVLSGALNGGVGGALDALKTRFLLIEGYVKKGLDLALEAAKEFGPSLLTWVLDTAVMIADQVISWGQAFIVWVAPYATRLVTELIKLGLRIVTWVISYAPVLAKQFLKWVDVLVGWVIYSIPLILNSLEKIIVVILDWVSRSAPIILIAGLDLVDQLLTAFGTLLPKLLQTLGVIITTVLVWVSDNGPRILVELLNWTKQILIWAGSMLPAFLDVLGKLITALAGWFVDNGPLILKMLVGWGLLFGDWAFNLFTQLLPQLGTFITSLLTYFQEQGPALLDKLWGWIKLGADNIGKLFNDALPVLLGVFEMLGTWVKNNAYDILDKFWGFLKAGANTVTMIMFKLGPLLGDIMGAIGDWVKNNAPDMLDKFFSFLKTGIDTVTLIMGKIGKILSDLIDPIGKWIVTNTPALLDKFWDFLKTGISTMTLIMGKLGKVLADLIPEIGTWINTNSQTMLDTFWGFLKTGVDTMTLIMGKLGPILRDLIPSIATWITNNTPDMLNTFWNFLKTGVDTMTIIMDKLGPALGDIVLSMGTWITNNTPDLLNHFWTFLQSTAQAIEIIMRYLGGTLGDIFLAVADWFITNHDKVLDTFWGFLKTTGDDIDTLMKKIQPALKGLVDGIVSWFTTEGHGKDIFKAFWTWTQDVTYFAGKTLLDVMPSIVQFTDMVTHEFYTGAKKFIDAMEKGIGDWIKTADGKQWVELGKALGGFILSGLKSSPFWAIITNLGGFIENNWNNPTNGGGIPKVPGHATGTNSANRGLALVGEQGMELIQDAQKKLMLVTQPMLLNFQGGEKVYSNQQTSSMFRSIPASASQIHNMYSNAYHNSNAPVVNHNEQYNLGVHTNQSPQLVGMSFGMMKVRYGKS